MKNILMISESYPPVNGAEALLACRFSRVLESFGWSITVLTVNYQSSLHKADHRLAPFIPKKSKIVTTGNLHRWLPRQGMVEKIIRNTFLFLGLPTWDSLWYPSAMKTGTKLLKENRYDVIYSRACGHVSNIVGLSLKEWSGLPWIAHFSDPWVDNPYYKQFPLQKFTSQAFERNILKKADRVVFVSQGTKDLVLAKYPRSWKNRSLVIPHAYDLAELPEGIHSKTNNPKLRFVYTGTFYKDIRTPIPLLNALASLLQARDLKSELEVLLIGERGYEYKALSDHLGLSEIVQFQGFKPREETYHLCKSADVLLVIDAPLSNPANSSVFLPSKLIDYLPFERLILGITPSNGASADLLKRLGCRIADPGNVNEIASSIIDIIIKWKNGDDLLPANFRAVAREYSIENTGKYLNEVFTDLVNSSKSSLTPNLQQQNRVNNDIR